MNFFVGRIFFAIVLVLYPVLIFCALRFGEFSPRKLALLLLLLVALRIFLFAQHKHPSIPVKEIGFTTILLLCGILTFSLDNAKFLLFYPVLVNSGMLCLFGATLFSKTNLVFRLATFADKRILRIADRIPIERYCQKVTIDWCIFFCINGAIALWTVLASDEKWWALYNGFISYILMGILFAVEYGVRKMKQGSLQSYISFSQIQANSRPDDSVVCFRGSGLSSVCKTWKMFKEDVSKLRGAISQESYDSWILNVEDTYHLLVAIFALFQSQKKILFTANRQKEFIREIRKPNVGFLNDTGEENSLQIPQVLERFSAQIPWQTFNAQKAQAALYTSGTTGVPKEIPKTAAQFENEADALAGRFASSFSHCNFYSTVNHHHIYGLAFSVFVPFSAGLPIRQTRFEFPEELEQILAEPAVIVASPAFLKRLVANRTKLAFKKKPFWLSAGGVLPDEVAHQVEELSGNGVQEIYGCTEAGAIATRRIQITPLWTPIPTNQITLEEDGRLKILSSYTEPEGFVTGDLGKIESDGTFSLLGRADSIVKIEEKRISLLEVENRLRETKLVRDVRVVPMAGKRQFLAAALVLNETGTLKFAETPKKEINAYFRNYLSNFLENTVTPKKWRYLEELPQDVMGKVKTRDIQKLFALPEDPNFKILRFFQNGNRLAVKIVVPNTSDYYDGHFPHFKLLPAVVQIDLALRFFRAFFQLPSEIDRISRTKFTSPILPDTPITFEESYSPELGKMSFRIVNGETVHASGSILLKKAP